jgi:hypothetical protein
MNCHGRSEVQAGCVGFDFDGRAAADRFGEREVLVAAGLIASIVVGTAVTQPAAILFLLLGIAGAASAAQRRQAAA